MPGEKTYLRYETILEIASWWAILAISWIIKWFYSDTTGLPFPYLIILSLVMATLLLFRFLPETFPRRKKIFIWCLISIVSVLVFEHFTGGAKSVFWFLYLLPIIVATATFKLRVVLFIVSLAIVFILGDAVWIARGFNNPVLASCLTKIFALTFISAFTYFLNKEALKIKSELMYAYGTLRQKQDEIQKINLELISSKDVLLRTTKDLEKANENLRRFAKMKS
ncbi:MAG: hypothetical protein NTZ48_03205, partial [Candidatus Omnitrophica bacterium]|nr:hypothetical protein [Candidatus Omnitrophota bacterium]